MRPEEVLARRLAAEVESELASLGALETELASAPPGDDTYALRARGSILHDFYNGIERVFVRIARELNGGVPRAEQWHRELIRNMALDIPAVRPAVIDTDLAGTLEEYLRFRHVFRNVYGAVLSAGRMRSLEARMPATPRGIPQSNTFLPRLDARRRVTGTAHGADFQGKLPSRVHHPWTKGSRSSSYPANRWLNPAGSREGDHAPVLA